VQEHSCERLRLEETRGRERGCDLAWNERDERRKDEGGRERERERGGEERLQSRLIYLIASPGLQPGFNASPSGRS